MKHKLFGKERLTKPLLLLVKWSLPVFCGYENLEECMYPLLEEWINKTHYMKIKEYHAEKYDLNRYIIKSIIERN